MINKANAKQFDKQQSNRIEKQIQTEKLFLQISHKSEMLWIETVLLVFYISMEQNDQKIIDQ